MLRSIGARRDKLRSALDRPAQFNKKNLHPYRLKVKELRDVLQLTKQNDGSVMIGRLVKVKDAIEGTAAIVGDTVYFGSFDQYLYAVSLADGKEKWKYKAGPIKAAGVTLQ